MKRTAVSLALVGLLTMGGRAAAVICTIDAVPAATLLLPYFELDLNNPNGLTTLFSINNASATAILTHVVIFSDLSVPVLDFDVYLTGYDVQSINLRDIIVNGNLPQTASAGQDPTDTISPKGPISQDINFASCNNILPLPPLDALTIAYLQAALTGNAVAGNFCHGGACCYGQNLGDNIARGYITVDTVNSCSFCEQTTGNTTNCPPNPNGGTQTYFGAGGTGVVTNQDVIWGDWFIVNAEENFAEGADLVMIEASPGVGVGGQVPANPATSTSGRYTFYGRYVGWTAVDNREPLATDFATRYLNGGPFSAGTSLLCWRDSKTNQSAFVCPAAAGNPSWYPLGDEGIVIFDEQEHPNTVQGCTHSPCLTIVETPCPAETQRVQVNGATLPTPFTFGWMYLDLNTTITGNPNPPVDPAAAQAWVVSTLASNGHFAVGLDAIQLDSACAAQHFVP
jgi:hypothetical protein